MQNHQPVSNADIQSFHEKHSEWRHENDALKAEFVFEDFIAAMQFMQAAGNVAEELNHHPEWCNVYNRVSVTLTTHDVGNQVTDLDLSLAERMSALAE